MTTDISWLPLSLRKNIDLPKVVYEPVNDLYGGYFINGTKEIIVVEYEPQVPSTIVHEYCHYLQDISGKLPTKGSNVSLFEKYSYNKAIRLYFRTQWWEMEALLLEHKIAPTAVSRFWLKALVLPSDTKFVEDICM